MVTSNQMDVFWLQKSNIQIQFFAQPQGVITVVDDIVASDRVDQYRKAVPVQY